MSRLESHLSLPLAAWTDTEGDGSRLLTSIVVNGCSLHLEAFAVEREGDEQIWATRTDDLSAIYAATGADGAWETVAIEDREYVLIATPYGQ